MTMLEVEGLNVSYGDIQVIRGVDLTADAGQLTAIFGPNGHGKSTLLKSICGLVPATSGIVRVDGEEVQGRPTDQLVARGIVLVAEDRHLFPEMTVMENLRLGAFSRAARSSEDANLKLVFDMFPKLADLRRREAATLSGGEARMLAIGRGLMSSPRLLAVDEPSFGLVPKMRHVVFDCLRQLADNGLTVLVVEQSTGRISELADQVYLIEDGAVVFGGDTAAALQNEEFKRVYLGQGPGGVE